MKFNDLEPYWWDLMGFIGIINSWCFMFLHHLMVLTGTQLEINGDFMGF